MISSTLENLIDQARQHTEMLFSVEKAECWEAQLEALSAAQELAEFNAETMACFRCSNGRWLMGWDDTSFLFSLGGCAGGVTLQLADGGAGHQLPGRGVFFCSQESRSPAPAGAGFASAPAGAGTPGGDSEWESWQKRRGEKS